MGGPLPCALVRTRQCCATAKPRWSLSRSRTQVQASPRRFKAIWVTLSSLPKRKVPALASQSPSGSSGNTAVCWISIRRSIMAPRFELCFPWSSRHDSPPTDHFDHRRRGGADGVLEGGTRARGLYRNDGGKYRCGDCQRHEGPV